MNLLQGRWLVVATILLAVVFAGSAALTGELAGSSSWALVLLNTAPLLLLARHPLAVALTFSITYPVWLGPLGDWLEREGHVLQSLPTLVALYATGAWSRPLWLRALALVTPIWMLSAAVTGLWDTSVDDLAYVALVLVIVWCLGVVDAGRRAQTRDLALRTRELEQAQDALAEQAVAEERARIARELHDVVAHAMSVITVQAGVGGHVLREHPDGAAAALTIIEQTGREALTELRRMLVVLRRDDQASMLPPQPGVADLPQLFANAEATGLRVVFSRSGTARGMAAGLDLAIYRVVQECLTNAAKHAPRSRVDVWLGLGPDRVEVTVTDHGSGSPTDLRRGQGLTGMAERVALYDGELAIAGSTSGFRVHAFFPVDSVRWP